MHSFMTYHSIRFGVCTPTGPFSPKARTEEDRTALFQLTATELGSTLFHFPLFKSAKSCTTTRRRVSPERHVRREPRHSFGYRGLIFGSLAPVRSFARRARGLFDSIDSIAGHIPSTEDCHDRGHGGAIACARLRVDHAL